MNTDNQVDNLQSEIDNRRKAIKTDSYAMSVSEWISLYQQGELELYSEFNQVLCWSQSHKTKFIESILIGIPIAPIFVYQRKTGIWEVLDGLQRLSSIYEFVGILKDSDGRLFPPLILQKPEYLPSLDSKVWKDKEYPDGSVKGLTQAQRTLITRCKINANILLEVSDGITKYELFQRVNSKAYISSKT